MMRWLVPHRLRRFEGSIQVSISEVEPYVRLAAHASLAPTHARCTSPVAPAAPLHRGATALLRCRAASSPRVPLLLS